LPPGRGAPPPALAPSAADAAATSSDDPATIAAKSFRSDSGVTFSSSLLTSRARRASSSTETSAIRRCPVRMRVAWYSSEPIVQPSVNIFTSVGLNDGLRALPVFSLSRLRVSSEASLERSTP
jgi:hypothetical protein